MVLSRFDSGSIAAQFWFNYDDAFKIQLSFNYGLFAGLLGLYYRWTIIEKHLNHDKHIIEVRSMNQPPWIVVATVKPQSGYYLTHDGIMIDR